MAHFWTLTDAHDWSVDPLDDNCPATLTGADPSIAVSIERSASSPDTWVVLADAALRLNGAALPLGFAVLSDRDELQLPGRSPVYFSTERLASVEPYPTTNAKGFCPRCKQGIDAGTSAVRCPACGLWHHASDTLPCWTYAPACAGCPQDTALDTGFRWTPEEL